MDPLRIRVLGPLTVDGLAASDLGSRKARTLVAALGIAGGDAVPTDELVELLWADAPPARPAEQVSVLASRLRRVLGSERIVRSDAGYALHADWIDVVELRQRVEEARSRADAGSPAAARAAAAAALELVRGRPAHDEDAPWFDERRGAVERNVADARAMLATSALEVGDAATAMRAAEALLDADPYDESALRILMRAHVALGRSASALAAYAAVRERLIDDLGADPSAETEQLHTSILMGNEAVATSSPVASHTRLAGRDREMSQLDALFEHAVAGGAIGAEIEGEPGIGKTSLVAAFTDAVHDRALVLLGRCDVHGRDLPLQPVLDALEGVLLVSDAAEVLGAEAAVIGPLVGATSTPEHEQVTSVRDAEEAQALLFRALLSVIERLAAGRPAVIVVEDTHLAGASTIEWLSFVLRRARRVLVITTRRPQPSARLTGTAHVALGPIDTAAAAELVGTARAEELYERSGGNPLFLLELAASDGTDVPPSIRSLVDARATSLGDEVATTVRAAAVLGPELDLDLLAAVLDRPLEQLLDDLEAAVAARLLVEDVGGIRFAHELLRDALAAAATSARRAYYHREAARVLAARPSGDPLDVAWHARQGGDAGLAATALVRAAAAASARHDVGLARALLDQSIELHDSTDARLARARLQVARWELDGARTDADEAIALGGGAAALEAAGWVAYYRREQGEALRFAEEGMARAADAGVRASCLTLAGRSRHTVGDLALASAHLEEAVAIAPPEVRGVAHTWLSALRMHQGRSHEASELAALAVVDEGSMNHPFAPLHAQFARAYALGALGRAAEALVAVDRLEALVEREAGASTLHRFTGVAANLRSWVLRNLGQVERAHELSEVSCAFPSDQTAYSEPRYVGYLDTVDGHLLEHQPDAALEVLDRIVDIEHWSGSMAWRQRERYSLQRARIALAASPGVADDGAAALAADVVADARARGNRRYELLATTVLARATGDLDEAALDAVLRELDEVAGLEVWWISAELAQWFGVDRWNRDATARAERLAAAAGSHGDALRAWAVRRFPALG